MSSINKIMVGDIMVMTDKEKELLLIFRNLNQYEQSVFLGKISEMILNKKKRKVNLLG